MLHNAPSFGMEEEYFLTDLATGRLATRVQDEFFSRCSAELGSNATRELLRSQLEVVSPVFTSTIEAARTMRSLRSRAAAIARSFGLGLTACGTHPQAAWHDQVLSDGDRARLLRRGYDVLARRNMVCGLHVHAGVPESVDRIRLMNRLVPWTPLFLALSTSSPFWDGEPTGLLSYRQAAFDEWPRTGLPGPFADEADFTRYVDLLVGNGCIDGPRSLWWVIRPSHHYPTLELRIADSCTRLDDAVAIAALYWCCVHAFMLDENCGAAILAARWPLVDENRWRAQRDGINATLIDARGGLQPLTDLLGVLLASLAPAARHLGCEETLQRLPALLDEGTSASIQHQIWLEALQAGKSAELATSEVVTWLVNTTAQVEEEN